MSDDLDDLKRAFDVATPAPSPDRKAEALALAMKNFDRLQETEALGRPTSDPEQSGIFRGVRLMLSQFSNRAFLTASTALAAVGLVVFLPVLQDNPAPGTLDVDDLLGALSADDAVADADVSAKPRPAAEPLAAPAEPVAEAQAVQPMSAPASKPNQPMGGLLLDSPAPAQQQPRVATGGRHMSAPAAESVPPGQGVQTRQFGQAAANSGYVANSGTVKKSQDVARMAAKPSAAPDQRIAPVPDTEAFANAAPNRLKVTAEDPVSTFSIDVDTASWAILRNSLSRGQLPPKDSVRIEEMVNYFSYDYPAPEGDQPFRASFGVIDTPWKEGTQIVQIGLQGALPAERPPLNLVFLIDTSGSMNQPTKLPLLKQSFRLMLGQLSDQDSVSIVTYAGSAGRVLDPTPATDRAKILAALDNLSAGGGTAGQQGLQQAYATAAEMAEDGAVSRVILATDGDFNIGISDPDALKDYISDQRDSGTYLSVLGFGRGNLDDATMQALAQSGNGMAAYIDTLAEAQKVLVDQLTGALVPIADDVKIQVEWNPAVVAEYRLIGYETRALNREDFNNDRVDAGEIGAGHQVTALYEITPVGSPARLTDPLRYGATNVASDADELGFLRLRFKAPGTDSSELIETPIVADAQASKDVDFAMAIAGFGQILRGSDLIGEWGFDDAIALAQSARGDDPFGYRQEAITLMRLAKSVSQ